jgi:thiamine pyrophosphate-dependent acetolactate synthase large subunit-like protein
LLMGMGGLATIGLQQPKNLTIIVLDNEMFGETGKQKSHTGRGTDLQAIAKACSITKTQHLANLSDIDTFAKDLETIDAGPRLALIKIADGETSRVLPSRDGVALKIRLRNALGLNNS